MLGFYRCRAESDLLQGANTIVVSLPLRSLVLSFFSDKKKLCYPLQFSLLILFLSFCCLYQFRSNDIALHANK